MLAKEHREVLRNLAKLHPNDRVQLIHQIEQEDLAEEEYGKSIHEKIDFKVSDEEWEQLKAHIMDGGGSVEAHHVLRSVLTAIMDNDQTAFWQHLFHFLKGAGKLLGVITFDRMSGSVTFNGVGPTAFLQRVVQVENEAKEKEMK